MKYRLPFGLYKLREASRTLGQFASTLQEIQAMELGVRERQPELLGCCTVADRTAWLKAVPEAVTFQLGYNVQPAIAALPDDGMPASWCRQLDRLLRHDIVRLVGDCDYAKFRIAHIHVEYSEMRNGRSLLLELVGGALELIDRAITIAEQYDESGQHQTNHHRD